MFGLGLFCSYLPSLFKGKIICKRGMKKDGNKSQIILPILTFWEVTVW